MPVSGSKEDELGVSELCEVLGQSLGVLQAAVVGERPIDDRDVESRDASQPLNLMEIAEVLPDSRRHRARRIAHLEHRRRSGLEVSHLNNALNLVLGCEVKQRRPFHEVAIVAVPGIAQTHLLRLPNVPISCANGVQRREPSA